MLNGFEWLYFLSCVVFCIYAFVDKEYVTGAIFTILTVVATINTIRINLKNEKK